MAAQFALHHRHEIHRTLGWRLPLVRAGQRGYWSEGAAAVTYADVARAQAKIAPHVSRTPLLTCARLDELAGCSLFLKCENLQQTGSFKARGALNAVLSLPALRTVGITAHSLGNHAAAVAFAARVRKLPCTVVIPRNAPASKIENTRSYGATVELCEPGTANREAAVRRVAEQLGYDIVRARAATHLRARAPRTRLLLNCSHFMSWPSPRDQCPSLRRLFSSPLLARRSSPVPSRCLHMTTHT